MRGKAWLGFLPCAVCYGGVESICVLAGGPFVATAWHRDCFGNLVARCYLCDRLDSSTLNLQARLGVEPKGKVPSSSVGLKSAGGCGYMCLNNSAFANTAKMLCLNKDMDNI